MALFYLSYYGERFLFLQRLVRQKFKNCFVHFSQFLKSTKKIWNVFFISVFSDYFWSLWGLNPGNQPHHTEKCWRSFEVPSSPQIACSLPLCDLKAAVCIVENTKAVKVSVWAINTAVKQENSLGLTYYKHSYAHTRTHTKSARQYTQT